MIALREQGRIAPELIDQEAADHRGVFGIDHGAGADDRRDHAAPVDVTDQHHRNPGGAGKAHIGDVARAQVDLGRRPRALRDDDVALRLEPFIAFQHGAEQLPPRRAEIARSQSAAHLTMDDELRCAVSLGLQQHRVHVGMWGNATGDRLQRLGTANLSAIGSDGGVVRHILWFEGSYPITPAHQRAAQSSHQHGLADIRPCSLQHDGAHAILLPGRIRQGKGAMPAGQMPR